jgi:hypothetical protein
MGNKEADSGRSAPPENNHIDTEGNEDAGPREDGAEDLTLPPVKEGLAGHTKEGGKHYRIQVHHLRSFTCSDSCEVHVLNNESDSEALPVLRHELTCREAKQDPVHMRGQEGPTVGAELLL